MDVKNLTLVEHGSPDSADTVNDGDAVDVGVGVGVGGKTGGVGVRADAGRRVGDPGAHWVVLVRVSAAFRRMAVAMKSPQPSPMPPDSRAFRQLLLAGPPVRRVERLHIVSERVTNVHQMQTNP
jgi:hypothetical protein